MATIYGATTNHWRCYINTWSSEDGYSVSAGLTVGIQDCGWGFQIWTGIVGTANANGAQNQVNTSFYTSTGSWSTKDITSASQRFTKGHSAYNVTLSGSVTNQSGYMNGTSSASQTITVPALASHTVSFNANGGSGAPGSFTKWYGEVPTIPTTKPTRTNYEFLGWSTSVNGDVAYKPGDKFGEDADRTLYAVWKLLYVAPSFTNALALRTGSASSTTQDVTGGYCYASFSWKVDTTVYTSNKLKSIVCKYYADGSSTATTATLTGTTSGTSGTANVHFTASINSVYRIECTITDNQNGTATASRSITTGVLPMEVANKGKSVGILSAAPSSAGLQLGGSGNPQFTLAADTTNNKFDSMAQIHGSTSTTGQGELTLSTQGLDSSGNVARGTINLVADTLKLNGVETRILKSISKQTNQIQWMYSDGLMVTFLDYALSSRDGYNTNTHCSYKKFVYITPYKNIFNVQTSIVNTAEVGYYGNVPSDCAASYMDSVIVRAYVDLAVTNIYPQAIIFGTWK